MRGITFRETQLGRISTPREQDRLGALTHETLATPRVLRRGWLLAAEREHVMSDLRIRQRLNVS